METPPLDGPQTMDLPDLAPHVDATTAAALDEAVWRSTTHAQPHAYIVRPKYPELYDAMTRLIADQGTRWRFRGTTFKYVRIGKYKYWMIPPVLNREQLMVEVPPEGGQRC